MLGFCWALGRYSNWLKWKDIQQICIGWKKYCSQIQPGSTCDLASRCQMWCDFRVFSQLEVLSSRKFRQSCFPCYSNLIRYTYLSYTLRNLPCSTCLWNKSFQICILGYLGVCSKGLLEFSLKTHTVWHVNKSCCHVCVYLPLRNLALQLEPMNVTALCSRGDTKPLWRVFPRKVTETQ